MSLSSLLSKALSIPRNVAALSKALEEDMTVMAILEDAIAGKETNDSVIQAVHEHLGSLGGRAWCRTRRCWYSPHLLQVIVRRVLEGAIDASAETDSTPSTSTAQKAHFFLVSQGAAPAQAPTPVERRRRSSGSLADLDVPPLQLVAEAVDKVCSGIYESVQEVCMSTLSTLSHPGVVRRQIGVLSEMASLPASLGTSGRARSLLLLCASSLCPGGIATTL